MLLLLLLLSINVAAVYVATAADAVAATIHVAVVSLDVIVPVAKAGACYRAAGEDGKATAMYTQAGECQCHDTVSAHASAAKDFREAALITERQGR